MNVVGVICEYDPFHLGHRRQFELIREQIPDARILCLMSGCFTQRGMPALHTPAARAQAALSAGADAVLELPAAFCVRDAEHFALGGVSILNALGFVTHISFGTEDGIDGLRSVAKLLEAPDEAFTAALREGLSSGLSHATAQGQALASRFPALADTLSKPNAILALCYLRALIRTRSTLVPLPVIRQGGYHETTLSADSYPSATAVRAAFLSGNTAEANSACGYALPQAPVCLPNALDRVLLHTLRAQTPEMLATLPLCSEGLENRLYDCARQAATRQELLELLKTKRYPRARLSRLLCHALLGVTDELLKAHPNPTYVRLLGLKKGSDALTSLFSTSRIPIISKAADANRCDPLFALDMRAYDLWSLGANVPAGLMLRQGVTVV